MDSIVLVKAAIMGVVEGLTEFLPISSTGHLILAGALLNFDDERAKVFDIAIQSGAILAVIIVYWQKIRDTLVNLGSSRRAQRFVANVVVGFLPAALVGLAAYKVIKTHLFNPGVVAGAFIVGGLIILWVEKIDHPKMRIQHIDDMSGLDALKVGLVQCLGMIPGTSRSGAVLGVVHAFRDEMIGEPIQALYVNANNLGDEGGHGLQITFGGRNWLGHIHAAVGEDRYILQATHSFQRSDLGVPAWELLVWLASLPG